MDFVAVVILNWNGKHFLEKFLPSVIKNSPEASIYVADNGSTDNSLQYLHDKFPSINTISLDKNYGFCEGYNRALDQIEAKYFVLLNSDIEVTPNWLPPQIAVLEGDSKVAACQPKIKSFSDKSMFEHAGAAGGYLDILGYPYCKGRIFTKVEKDTNQYNENADVLWASGAALFVRAELFKRYGGLDKRFFAHMEEIDLCWRFINKGYKIKFIADSTVYHVGGGTLHKSNPQKTYLNFRNGLALLFKNLPKRYLPVILILRMLMDGIAAVEFFLVGYPKDAFAVFRAHMSFYTMLPYLIKKRPHGKHKIPKMMTAKSIVFQHFILGRDYYHTIR